MISNEIFLNHLGVVCALGSEPEVVLDGLLSGNAAGMVQESGWIESESIRVGKVDKTLPSIADKYAHSKTRNNQLLLAALEPIREAVNGAIAKYGPSRVGVIVGTSTSGIADVETALVQYHNTQSMKEGYDYRQQELGNPSLFLADVIGAEGPAYTISTACSSGAKALASARRLIQAGICDVVVAGGGDSLCKLTLQGFSSLEAVAKDWCHPFAENRDGINIGEAAALFVVSREEGPIALVGVGESSDAHHISAPHPQGSGAILAMNSALSDAGVSPGSVDYLNLHGTATLQNDAMEAIAVNQVLGAGLPVSSTKPLTGHTLGAAGALEAAFCWLLLSHHNRSSGLPVNLMESDVDPDLPEIGLVKAPASYERREHNYMMSNSFAFGGNNIALILKGAR